MIYLTSSPDFALESYQARAFSYLLKPMNEPQLFSILDEAIHAQKKRRENGLQVKTRDGVVFPDGQALGLPKAACVPLRNAWSNYWLEGGSGNV